MYIYRERGRKRASERERERERERGRGNIYIYIYICISLYIQVARVPRIIHNVLRTCMYVCIYVYIYILYIYIYIYILHIVSCMLPIACCLLQWRCAAWALPAAEKQRYCKACVRRLGFMRHGHEMLWFLRGSFSESELTLSYNAKVQNARGCAHSINWLRDQPFEQGMTIYI